MKRVFCKILAIVFREACNLAKQVVCRSEALSELLVSVNLDIYISQTTSNFKAKDQGKDKTCCAFACAAVLHMAMKRIHGRDGGHPEFEELKDKMISQFGINSTGIIKVLKKNCNDYRLRFRSKISIEDAKKAISEKRPVIAAFSITTEKMRALREFGDCEKNRTAILTQKDLDVPNDPGDPLAGHAVVLTSYNSECLTFMNSWGNKWADSGFFRVENAKVLGDKLRFYDVYWELDDLSEEEKESYRKSDSEAATKLFELLKGLKHAKYKCRECEQESLVTEFTGTLSKVRCPNCSCEFSTNDNAGNILALNIYLISLSR